MSDTQGVSAETPTPSTPSSFLDLYASQVAEAGGGDNPEIADLTPTDPLVDNGEVAATESGTPSTDPVGNWWDEHASKPVRVKVRGEEVEVPFDELMNGYMRQADYTRSKQEIAEARRLAEWAAGFQQQLKDDPARVIATLSAAFQTEATQPQIDPVVQQLAKLVEADPELQPLAIVLLEERQRREALERELAEQASRFQETETQRQQREAFAQVEREIAQVRQEYPDFDENVALDLAARSGDLKWDLRKAWEYHLKENGQWPVQAPTPAPAPAPAPQQPNPVKQALAASQTNTRTVGTPDVPNDEWDSFEELYAILERQSATQR
jgi:hypothetical protein